MPLQSDFLDADSESRRVPVAKPGETLPAVVVPPPAVHTENVGTALADLREQAMNVPVAVQTQGLVEYKERRDNLRSWIKSQFVEGVHFGFPPGCFPQSMDDPNGNPPGRYYKSGKNWVHESQWQPKPSLYKAGADFIADLMGWRDEYATDMDTWTQLGKPEGVMIRRCSLFSRSTGQLVGNGSGGRKNGDKYMDVNASLKMADKAAKVAAVMNALGLSDLFTQDVEDKSPPQYDNPEQNADAPQVKTRAERQQPQSAVTKAMIAPLYRQWREAFNDNKENWPEFVAWVRTKGGLDDKFDGNPSLWTEALLQTVKENLP